MTLRLVSFSYCPREIFSQLLFMENTLPEGGHDGCESSRDALHPGRG